VDDAGEGELVGHVLDVPQKAHGGVLVGVGGVGVVALDLEQLVHRVGAVLVVFAEHRPGLRLEVLLGVIEVLEGTTMTASPFGSALSNAGRGRMSREAFTAIMTAILVRDPRWPRTPTALMGPGDPIALGGPDGPA
jgi:hypothetical protein